MKPTSFIRNSALFIVMLAVSSCSKKEDTPLSPDKVQLTFPAQNSLCTSGTVLSSTQTSVTLTWTVANNTDSYEINIKNLLTGTATTQNSTTNKLTAVLLRNTPYSWYVVSTSNVVSNTAASDTWRFYVAGEGVKTYSPFPAKLTAPAFGTSIAAGTVDLTWLGSDVDNNIVSYDVYFDTSPSPVLLKAGVKDLFLKSVAVASGRTYYWRVLTKDSQGNISDSGIYQFEVK